MKASDAAKVWKWLEDKEPGAVQSRLKEVAQQHFGEIKWDSQMGWGEGMITCEFPKYNVKGQSCGDCTSEEALMEALIQLI